MDALLIILSLFFIPAIYILLGVIFSLWIPQNRNGSAGYRTTRSRKSEETWIYANKLSGKIILILGIVLMAINLIIFFAFKSINITACVVLIIIDVILIALPLFITESKLKEKFDEDGNPKN